MLISKCQRNKVKEKQLKWNMNWFQQDKDEKQSKS